MKRKYRNNGILFCPKKLSEIGGYPPPLSGNNPFVVFDGVPYTVTTTRAPAVLKMTALMA